MRIDNFGQIIYSEQDLCEVFLKNTKAKLDKVLVEDNVTFSSDLDLEYMPELIKYQIQKCTQKEFDTRNQTIWFMPEQYQNMDIAKFVLDLCNTEAELQRAGEELILFQEKNMFMLLRYLKYLVDTMRNNNIVWGVGRGSSVASFVLFLIGVHKVNSLYYDLSINEFLK